MFFFCYNAGNKLMPMLRIAINGFGRIGRAAFKIASERKNIQLVGINDLADPKTLAHLLKYDTVYGRWNREVSFDKRFLIVGRQKIPVFQEKDPVHLPWKKLKVDMVLECTGAFLTEAKASAHLVAGARQVILSAPAEDDAVPTHVLSVNHEQYDPHARVISNASCTTNCIAPVAAVIHANFGVVKAAMTTIHAYTADQRLHDAPHHDLRRARAAAANIVPTSTGAAIATTKTIPELAGLFDGIAIRVPVAVGSLSDFTFLLSKKTTVKEVNDCLIRASKHAFYKKTLAVTSDPIVSSDIIGSTFSSIVDLGLTKVVDGDLVKIISWYDNEWGYSTRLVDMAEEVHQRSMKFAKK